MKTYRKPNNKCDCGAPATTTHAGDKCCQRCKEVVTAAQEDLHAYIEKFYSGVHESDSKARRAVRMKAYDVAHAAERRAYRKRAWAERKAA